MPPSEYTGAVKNHGHGPGLGAGSRFSKPPFLISSPLHLYGRKLGVGEIVGVGETVGVGEIVGVGETVGVREVVIRQEHPDDTLEAGY